MVFLTFSQFPYVDENPLVMQKWGWSSCITNAIKLLILWISCRIHLRFELILCWLGCMWYSEFVLQRIFWFSCSNIVRAHRTILVYSAYNDGSACDGVSHNPSLPSTLVSHTVLNCWDLLWMCVTWCLKCELRFTLYYITKQKWECVFISHVCCGLLDYPIKFFNICIERFSHAE